ncbi:hypothetical protein TNCV_4783951 [Trichonephila clavipes]|nr:hypothetical protein TNCV_4783951 [Trichonephila clavipes]
MNVRYMSKDKFASCEKVTAEVMKSYAQEEMVKTILDEKPLAESREELRTWIQCVKWSIGANWYVYTKNCFYWCSKQGVFDMLCHRKWKDGKERSSVLEKLERTINSNGGAAVAQWLRYPTMAGMS